MAACKADIDPQSRRKLGLDSDRHTEQRVKAEAGLSTICPDRIRFRPDEVVCSSLLCWSVRGRWKEGKGEYGTMAGKAAIVVVLACTLLVIGISRRDPHEQVCRFVQYLP